MDTDNAIPPVTSGPEISKPADNQTLLSVLAYVGPLVIVSDVLGKDVPFVKFHIKQGAILFAIEVIVWILGSMFWGFWMFINLINLATLVLSIIGIINAAQHKQDELPLVGSFSKYFNF